MELNNYKNWNFVKPYFDDDIVPITGFGEFGSILVEQNIGFNDFFDLEFSFKIIDQPENEAALLDLDFNKSLFLYASLIFINDSKNDTSGLHFITSDSTGKFNHFILPYDFINKDWNRVKVLFENQKLSILINDSLCEYTFMNDIDSVRPSIGNNMGVEKRSKTESILIKDINLIISPRDPVNIDFPDIWATQESFEE